MSCNSDQEGGATCAPKFVGAAVFPAGETAAMTVEDAIMVYPTGLMIEKYGKDNFKNLAVMGRYSQTYRCQNMGCDLPFDSRVSAGAHAAKHGHIVLEVAFQEIVPVENCGGDGVGEWEDGAGNLMLD